MATIKFGAIVTDMRGKLGGHVFQKGNQSSVLKQWSSPRQSPSFFKDVRTANLGSVRNSWNALSTNARLQWNLLAPNYFFKNKFGDTVAYNGYQLFLYVNMNQLKGQQSLITSPANLSPNVPRSILSSAAIDVGAGTLAISGTLASGSIRLLNVAQRKSRGSLRVSPNKFSYFGSQSTFAGPSTGAYINLVRLIGPIAVGDIIYIGVRDLNASGFINRPIYVLATIT